MFDSLKKKLREGVQKLADKISQEAPAGKPEKTRPEARPPAKKPEAMPVPRPEKAKVSKPAEPKKPETKAGIPKTEAVKIEADPEVSRPEPAAGLPEPAKAKPEPEREEEISEAPREVKEEPEAPKRGFFGRLKAKVVEKTLAEEDIDNFFRESETDLLQSNVALSVIDKMKADLKASLADRPISRTKAREFITLSFEQSLLDIVDQGEIDMEGIIKKARAQGKPACFIFLGFNGGGKTTSIAKVAHLLKKKGFRPVLAAGDTFRAASIEQLEHHGNKLGIKTIKTKYGADSAAVIFDARKYAEANGCDVVIADTAGRMHTDKNLMDELKKVVRVNNPDLKILVVDSLTGNDAVEQAEKFNEGVGVDAVFLTKIDVNKKGGAVLSVCHTIKKPILFLGTGQEYGDMEVFDPRKFVKQIME